MRIETDVSAADGARRRRAPCHAAARACSEHAHKASAPARTALRCAAATHTDRASPIALMRTTIYAERSCLRTGIT
jgi:hypothetical protein